MNILYWNRSINELFLRINVHFFHSSRRRRRIIRGQPFVEEHIRAIGLKNKYKFKLKFRYKYKNPLFRKKDPNIFQPPYRIAVSSKNPTKNNKSGKHLQIKLTVSSPPKHSASIFDGSHGRTSASLKQYLYKRKIINFKN